MAYQGDAFLADISALPEKVAADDWSATVEDKSGVSSLAVWQFDILRAIFTRNQIVYMFYERTEGIIKK